MPARDLREADLLHAEVLPNIEQLAAVVAAVDPDKAGQLRDADDVLVQLLLRHDEHQQLTPFSAHSASVLAVGATWTHQSWSTGRILHLGVAVLQVIDGGLDGGEGYAYATQRVWTVPIDRDIAAAAALLVVRRALPTLARAGDL